VILRTIAVLTAIHGSPSFSSILTLLNDPAQEQILTIVTDLVKAAKDPRNLRKDTKAIEDVLLTITPPVIGLSTMIAIEIYVHWVYASGGGTISLEAYPIRNGQTTLAWHRGRNAQ